MKKLISIFNLIFLACFICILIFTNKHTLSDNCITFELLLIFLMCLFKVNNYDNEVIFFMNLTSLSLSSHYFINRIIDSKTLYISTFAIVAIMISILLGKSMKLIKKRLNN